MYYIGLDVHKKTISYCVKDASAVRSTEKGRSEQRGMSWLAGYGPFLSHGSLLPMSRNGHENKIGCSLTGCASQRYCTLRWSAASLMRSLTG